MALHLQSPAECLTYHPHRNHHHSVDRKRTQTAEGVSDTICTLVFDVPLSLKLFEHTSSRNEDPERTEGMMFK